MADEDVKSKSTQDGKLADDKAKDNEDEKTLAQDEEEDNDESVDKKDKKPTIEMTQEELDKKFAERSARAERAAAKKYEKMIADLTDKIKSFEDKDLSEVEKLKKNFGMSSEKAKELERELTATKLENAKMKALFKAGALPDQLEGLLKRVTGGSEEEIEADVEELKSLGWIGSKPEPKKEETIQEDKKESTEKKQEKKGSAQGAGHHQVKDKDGVRTYSRAEIKDQVFYKEHREDILKAMSEGRIRG